MILTTEQIKEFEEVAKPLIKFLNDICYPHVTAIVTCGSAEITEGLCIVKNEDYLKG